jgi:glycosyltransferase involved in cell wall biosynthesis
MTMRLLYITNGFPWPLTTGYLRHYFLIRQLAAAGHGVTLLSVVGADHRPEDRHPLEPFTEQLITFPSLDRSSRRLGKAARRLTGEPAARAMAGAIEQLVAGARYDACVFSGRRTAAALAALPAGLPVVADLCDATSARLRTELRTGSRWRAPLTLIDLVQVRGVERSVAATAAHLLFASERDRDAVLPAHHPARARTTVLPNGVDVDFWTRRSSALGEAVVFTGTMSYPPNEDAALHLLTAVVPAVRRDEPGVPVLIVGRDPVPRLLAEAGAMPKVTVTGFVDDVRPWLERAAVLAAPLRQGAGIQNKVLEAMAMGVPVVASPLASEGLRMERTGDPPVTVVDGADMAAAVVERIRAARAGAPPDDRGRAYVTEHFSWAHSGDLLEEALQQVIADRCRQP